MAVKRSQNWLNQQRVDVPHVKSIESAIRNDFDELISSFATGEDRSYVLRGFELNMAGAVGSAANSLQMIVADSALFHGASNESGTFLQVPIGTPNEVINSTSNEKVTGSFTPSTINYIGIELVREIADSTTGQLFLWNPSNKTEFGKTAPLAKLFDYNIIVTSAIWASNVLPIAVVETDGANNVVSVEDRRPMMFRLGSGGVSTPNPENVYAWADGRAENFWKSTTATSPFQGGDKQLGNDKDWKDAVMSIFKEILGTPYWYSLNEAGSLLKLKGDFGHLQMTGSGKFSHSASSAGQINWDSDIFLNFVGSRLTYRIDSNAATTDITLSDDQVAYIEFVRGVDIAPSIILTNGSPIISSVGAVSWTTGLQADDYIKLAIENDTRYFKILSVDSASQVTLTENYDGTSTGSDGTKCQYAYGSYQTNGIPSTSRHVKVADRKDVPFNEDLYWIFLRADNGGAAAKVYIKGSAGGELEQGEDREISDNQTSDVLEYIGAQTEVDQDPDYTNAITAGVAEVATITFPAAAAITSGQSFNINSALDLTEFYVWADKDSAGGDPGTAGKIPVEVDITAADTAVQVAGKYQAVLDALGEFNVADNLDGTITITNSQVGATTNASNVDMPGGFSINIDTEGAGAFNHTVVDDENLTKSIKRLDSAVQLIQDAIDTEPYEERIDIIGGAPSNDRELTGPVVASTSVKIPKNTRNSSAQETYEIGEADIIIHLNGNRLLVSKDYTESSTTEVQFTFQLEVGDVLEFSKPDSNGSTGSDTTGTNLGSAKDADVFKQTAGSQLQFRRLEAGANVVISQDGETVNISANASVGASNTKSVVGANYVALSTDDVILVTNSGTDVTITLPDASSVSGKIFHIKKIDSGNTLFIKSVLAQTLDGVDIDATPHSITTQFENLTIVAAFGNYFIL